MQELKAGKIVYFYVNNKSKTKQGKDKFFNYKVLNKEKFPFHIYKYNETNQSETKNKKEL